MKNNWTRKASCEKSPKEDRQTRFACHLDQCCLNH